LPKPDRDDEDTTMSLEPAPQVSPPSEPGFYSAIDPPAFVALASAWQPATDLTKFIDLKAITPPDLGAWIDRLRRAGIIADRHSTPDLYEQLKHTLRRPIDTVLCTVLDADPVASLSTALAAQFPLELAAAVIILDRITHSRRTAIVTDASMPAGWFRPLRKICSDLRIRIEPISNDYPQADPTLLLYTLLGRRLRPGRLPTEQGVLVLDAAAAIAIGRYALLGEPMLQSPVVVRDHVVDQVHYLTVPIGITLAEILEKISVPRATSVLRGGDLLRDVRLTPDFAIGGGELVFHVAGQQAAINPDPCIRCGWCAHACPTRVQPAAALEAAQQEDINLAERAGIEACIECGICSYVCPSFLPLMQSIRKMRRALKIEPAK
jgi:electron transport complex protein RnfC